MAFKDFPEQLYIKTLDSSEEANLGSFDLSKHIEIGSGHLMIYINGTYNGSEQFRINIYSENDNLIANGDWSSISDISNIGANWIGWLRFDFNREHLHKDHVYILKIESSNYTRNADTYYIGFILDWPLNTNSQANNNAGADVALFGYR